MDAKNPAHPVEPDDEFTAAAEEEQAEPLRQLPTPHMPTRSEVLDHRCTHVPFRAWCPHCVEGRGR